MYKKEEVKTILTSKISDYIDGLKLDIKSQEDVERVKQGIAQYVAGLNLSINNNFADQIKKLCSNVKHFSVTAFHNTTEKQKTDVLKILGILNYFEKIPFSKYDDTDFSNGNYCIQHIPENIDKAIKELYDATYAHKKQFKDDINKFLKEGKLDSKKGIYDPVIAHYFVRHLESTSNPVEIAIYYVANKLMNMSHTSYKEYGQMYYINNEHGCKNVYNKEVFSRMEKKEINSHLKNLNTENPKLKKTRKKIKTL